MVGAAEQTQEQLLTRSSALLLPGMSPPSLDISEPPNGASFDLRAKEPVPLARGVQWWGLSLPGAGTAHPAAGAGGQPAVVSLTPVQPSSLRILDVRLGYFELGNGPAPLLQRGQQRRWI